MQGRDEKSSRIILSDCKLPREDRDAAAFTGGRFAYFVGGRSAYQRGCEGAPRNGESFENTVGGDCRMKEKVRIFFAGAGGKRADR